MDWYRWFPGLYSEATLHLTLEQDAIYRRLIDWYMQNRLPLPSHGTALARICQISLEKWSEHQSIVLGFFKIRGDRYHHKRCDIELDRQDSKSKKLSDAAKKSQEVRRRKLEISDTSEPSYSQASAKVAIEERRSRREEKREEEKEEGTKPTKGASNAKRHKPTSFIPEDFRGDIGSIALAGELGLDAERECREFIDYWRGRGEARADWQATFRNRLRKVAEYRTERQQRQTDGRPGVRDVTGAAFRVASRLQEKA